MICSRGPSNQSECFRCITHCFIAAFETCFAPVQEINALLRMEPSDAENTMSIARDRGKTWCSRGTRARLSDDVDALLAGLLLIVEPAFHISKIRNISLEMSYRSWKAYEGLRETCVNDLLQGAF
jgi:hypothetical protein